MKYLLKNLQVIDADSPYHGKKVDILLSENSIEKISSDSLKLSKTYGETHDFEGSFVSTGFCDLYVGDPGFEYRRRYFPLLRMQLLPVGLLLSVPRPTITPLHKRKAR